MHFRFQTNDATESLLQDDGRRRLSAFWAPTGGIACSANEQGLFIFELEEVEALNDNLSRGLAFFANQGRLYAPGVPNKLLIRKR